MPASRLILAAAATAILAVAAPAGAATITAPPCVLTVDSVGDVPLVGTGFTPGALVNIARASSTSPTPTPFTTAMADAAGNFATTASAPPFNPFSRKLQTFQVGAADSLNPANVATTSFQQVRAGYEFKPSSGRPSRIVTHTARGFRPGKNTWLHLRFGGRTIRTVKLGKATAPCGIVTKRLPLLPARSRRGTWRYYVDQKQAYSATTRPQATSGLRITTVFR
jgi:hypothetical protein